MARKKLYKPRSWSKYNKSLIARGSLSLWINDDLFNSWHSNNEGKPGAPRKYSDQAISAALRLRSIYQLTLRATQGLLESIFRLMNVNLPVPHYSTFSRRMAKLHIELNARRKAEPMVLAIDSSGLKVFGEGEWKVRTHGYDKRRTWRKFHVGIDTEDQVIHAVTVTTNDFKDSEVFEATLDQVNSQVKLAIGDGAYDSKNCFDYCECRGITGIFPPRKGARLRQHGNCKDKPVARDEIIRDIRKNGRKAWKIKSGYHRRSLAETAMFRFKKLFSGMLSSRRFINQGVEVFLKCQVLNKFNELGLANTIAMLN